MKKKYVEKIEGKEWGKCIDSAFEKKRKDLKIDGFRKGQCPKNVYIKKYGVESLYMDAVDEGLRVIYDKLLSNKDTIKPICPPSVDIKSINNDLLEVEMTFVSSPEVKLGKYKDLKIKKDSVEVTDEEVEHELFHIKNEFAEIKVVENESLKEGDIACIDFKGFKDGKPFEGGEAKDYSLTIGSHSFIPGFEESLVGMKTGEEKSIDLEFPKDYQAEELKGQKVVFEVKLNEIKQRLLPEADENFFKDLGMEGIDSIEKLEKEIRGNIKAGKEKQVEEGHIFKCLDKVVENSKFEIDEEITESELDRMVEEFNQQLSYQGMSLDKYLEITKSKIEDLRNQMKAEANKRIGYRIVIDEIIKEEGLVADEKEVNKTIDEMIEKYSVSKDEFLKNIGGEDVIRHDILVKSVFKVISE